MRLIDADVLPEISLFGTTEYINVKNAPTIQAIPLDRVKQARAEINEIRYKWDSKGVADCLAIIDKLIAESEDK